MWVRPFGDIYNYGAAIPVPKRKARRVITEGLVYIFLIVEKQLKTLNKPYYYLFGCMNLL